MTVERDELRLLWPARLFATEALAMLDGGHTGLDCLAGLMAEAFHADRGEKVVFEAHQSSPPPQPAQVLETGHHVLEVWDQPPTPGGAERLVRELAEAAESLPVYAPRQYYRSRHSPNRTATAAKDPAVILEQLREEYGALLAELTSLGYFDDAFGSWCNDSRENPDAAARTYLATELGEDLQQLWKNVGGAVRPRPEWPGELLYEVIEALYEVVARPRRRSWHDFGEHWDYFEFSRPAGRAVYAWRVNHLLEHAGADVRLIDAGAGLGHVVHVTLDDRDSLVDQVLATPDPQDRDAVAHAVGLVRSRSASRHDKRSAVVALARILESRRNQIKAELSRRDEGPLFEIANRFDLRHRDERQLADYDDAFLDWVFWWYLGTIELTDRIRARQKAERVSVEDTSGTSSEAPTSSPGSGPPAGSTDAN